MDVEGGGRGPSQGRLEDHGECLCQLPACNSLQRLTPLQAWVCIMFAALNIDRNNINNAVSDNMLDDLGLNRSDYVSSLPDKMGRYRRADKSPEPGPNHRPRRFPRG